MSNTDIRKAITSSEDGLRTLIAEYDDRVWTQIRDMCARIGRLEQAIEGKPPSTPQSAVDPERQRRIDETARMLFAFMDNASAKGSYDAAIILEDERERRLKLMERKP